MRTTAKSARASFDRQNQMAAALILIAFLAMWRQDGGLVDGGGGAVKVLTNLF